MPIMRAAMEAGRVFLRMPRLDEPTRPSLLLRLANGCGGQAMASSSKSKSAAVRARLSHPVIDSDGHHVEYGPRVRDYVKQVAGAQMADRVGPALEGTIASSKWYRQSPDERRAYWTKRSPFWGLPTKNTLDLATSLF